MLPLFGVVVAVLLLAVGVYGWTRWFAVFDGPDGERYRRRAAQGPFAAPVDVHDGPGSGHPAADPRDEGR